MKSLKADDFYSHQILMQFFLSNQCRFFLVKNLVISKPIFFSRHNLGMSSCVRLLFGSQNIFTRQIKSVLKLFTNKNTVLSYLYQVTLVKSTVNLSSILVAFLKNTNFTYLDNFYALLSQIVFSVTWPFP